MNSNPTLAKVFAKIIFAFIPTVFCAIVCISTAFTHALDGWLLPCGIYMVFVAVLEFIGIILSCVFVYIKSKAWQE